MDLIYMGVGSSEREVSEVRLLTAVTGLRRYDGGQDRGWRKVGVSARVRGRIQKSKCC